MLAGLAAIGAGVGQMAGTLINNRQQRKMAQDAWNRETAYNDPSAQMSRLKAAGLNPNLIYGTVNNGQQNYDTPNVNDPVAKALESLNVAKLITDISRTKADTALVNGQTSKLASDQAYVDANTSRVLSENKKLGIDVSNAERELKHRIAHNIYGDDPKSLSELKARVSTRAVEGLGVDKKVSDSFSWLDRQLSKLGKLF